MTTRKDAYDLWGEEAVEKALDEPKPTPYSERYLLFVQDRARELPPAAFRLWALSQPWPDFCFIVRIVSGVLREELMREVH